MCSPRNDTPNANSEKLKHKLFAYNEKVVLDKFFDLGASFYDENVKGLHSYDDFGAF